MKTLHRIWIVFVVVGTLLLGIIVLTPYSIITGKNKFTRFLDHLAYWIKTQDIWKE